MLQTRSQTLKVDQKTTDPEPLGPSFGLPFYLTDIKSINTLVRHRFKHPSFDMPLPGRRPQAKFVIEGTDDAPQFLFHRANVPEMIHCTLPYNPNVQTSGTVIKHSAEFEIHDGRLRTAFELIGKHLVTQVKIAEKEAGKPWLVDINTGIALTQNEIAKSFHPFCRKKTEASEYYTGKLLFHPDETCFFVMKDGERVGCDASQFQKGCRFTAEVTARAPWCIQFHKNPDDDRDRAATPSQMVMWGCSLFANTIVITAAGNAKRFRIHPVRKFDDLATTTSNANANADEIIEEYPQVTGVGNGTGTGNGVVQDVDVDTDLDIA